MKTISQQIQDFLSLSGKRAAELSRVSGIHPVYISKLKNGTHKDTCSRYADKLRAAMVIIDPVAAKAALEEKAAV